MVKKSKGCCWKESCITEKTPKICHLLQDYTQSCGNGSPEMLHAEHEQVSIAVEQLLYKRQQRLHQKNPQDQVFQPCLGALLVSTESFL